MEQRVDFYKASPEVLKGMIALENVVGSSASKPPCWNWSACACR